MTRRFALLADVHGNLEALEAVLADVDRRAPGARIVCAGDVVGYGPDPEGCLARLEDRNALLVRGNHEELVLGLRDLTECVHAGIVAARYTRKTLSARALFALRALPSAIAASPELIVCHGDLRNAGTYVSNAERADAALVQLAERSPTARVLVCGHTHHAMLYARSTGYRSVTFASELPLPVGEACVINPGSVGQARDDAPPRARWALLDLERHTVTYASVGFDHASTIRKMARQGLVPEVVMPPPQGVAKRLADAKKRWTLSFGAERLPRFDGAPSSGASIRSAEDGPKVSAVVVTYNSRDYLEQSIGSLRESRDAGMLADCYVVDNSSADDTCARVRESDPWCTLLESGGNLGFGRGANLGLSRATTPYVLLLNPDAALPRSELSRLVAFLESHPRAGAVAPGIRQPDGRLQFAGGMPTPEDLVRDALYRCGITDRRTIEPGSEPFRTNWICGAVVLFRRTMLEHVGLFDPRYFLYFEETDLFRRAQLAGWELWATGEAMATHAQGASAKTVRRDLYEGCLAEHFYRSRFQFLASHYGWPRAASAELAELGLLSARAAVDTLRRRDIEPYWTRLRAPLLGARSLLPRAEP